MDLNAAFDGIIRTQYVAAALELCGMTEVTAVAKAGDTTSDGRSFVDYLSGWFSREGNKKPENDGLLASMRDTFGKIFTRREIYNFTGVEVCDMLHRAIYLVSSGTEGQFLSDRLEPWIGLARPISHNLDTRVYYWPEIEI